MPFVAESVEERVFRVANVSSFSRIEVSRSSETAPTSSSMRGSISDRCANTTPGIAAARATPSNKP
jgi:hypothetical protein